MLTVGSQVELADGHFAFSVGHVGQSRPMDLAAWRQLALGAGVSAPAVLPLWVLSCRFSLDGPGLSVSGSSRPNSLSVEPVSTHSMSSE